MTDTFSRTYAEARGKFLDAAKGAGAALTTYAHPGQGPDGGALATDVARLGESNAPNLFIATSATHGVEGFCGSGCMVGFLEKRLHAELPRGTAMVLVHAINPHGFAHERRVNEDNVDLNRNFVDHAAPRAPNAAYDAIHAMQVPEDWDGPARAEADRHIAAYIAAHGMKTYQAAVTGGQYTHPDGLFYGGRAPVWSHRTWREIIKTHVAPVRRVAYVDFHTGLGPRGYGEPISREAPDSPVFHRARAWYGAEVTSTRGGTSTSAVVEGDTSRVRVRSPRARGDDGRARIRHAAGGGCAGRASGGQLALSSRQSRFAARPHDQAPDPRRLLRGGRSVEAFGPGASSTSRGRRSGA